MAGTIGYVAASFCNNCGRRLDVGSGFCPTCGWPAASSADIPTASVALAQGVAEPGLDDLTSVALEAVREHLAVLVVKRGPNAGSRFLVGEGKTTIGREVDADVFLDDVTVSRRHAVVLREGPRCVVRDAGSLNGTFINGERRDATELRSGDEVQIGRFRLVYLAGDPQG